MTYKPEHFQKACRYLLSACSFYEQCEKWPAMAYAYKPLADEHLRNAANIMGFSVAAYPKPEAKP